MTFKAKTLSHRNYFAPFVAVWDVHAGTPRLRGSDETIGYSQRRQELFRYSLSVR